MRTDLPRVLLVEDDPTIAQAYAKLFTIWGWQPVKAHTVAEAMSRLDEPLNLVVLDLMLPDGSGVEVLSEIRARKLPVPVAVMSGKHPATVIEEVSAYTPDQILFKPYVFEALQDFAKVLLDLFRSSQPAPKPVRSSP